MRARSAPRCNPALRQCDGAGEGRREAHPPDVFGRRRRGDGDVSLCRNRNALVMLSFIRTLREEGRSLVSNRISPAVRGHDRATVAHPRWRTYDASTVASLRESSNSGTSAPVPVASAMGTNPSEATRAVINTGRRRVNAPSKIASSSSCRRLARSPVAALSAASAS